MVRRGTGFRYRNDSINLRNDPSAKWSDLPKSRLTSFFNLVPFLLVFGISTSLKFSEDIAEFDRERKERENENLKSELALLRSQI